MNSQILERTTRSGQMNMQLFCGLDITTGIAFWQAQRAPTCVKQCVQQPLQTEKIPDHVRPLWLDGSGPTISVECDKVVSDVCRWLAVNPVGALQRQEFFHAPYHAGRNGEQPDEVGLIQHGAVLSSHSPATYPGCVTALCRYCKYDSTEACVA
jgi:hypothetical protein